MPPLNRTLPYQEGICLPNGEYLDGEGTVVADEASVSSSSSPASFYHDLLVTTVSGPDASIGSPIGHPLLCREIPANAEATPQLDRDRARALETQAQGSEGEERFQNLLYAGAIYAQLGSQEDVRRTLESARNYLQGLPEQTADLKRLQGLSVIAELYQQAGMTADTGDVYSEIIIIGTTSDSVECQGIAASAQLASGDVEGAAQTLQGLPSGNPVRQSLLPGVERMRRLSQLIHIWKTALDQYLRNRGGSEADLSEEERSTLEDTLLQTAGFQQASQRFVAGENLVTVMGESSNPTIQAFLRETPCRETLETLSNPQLSQDDFSRRAVDQARALYRLAVVCPWMRDRQAVSQAIADSLRFGPTLSNETQDALQLLISEEEFNRPRMAFSQGIWDSLSALLVKRSPDELRRMTNRQRLRRELDAMNIPLFIISGGLSTEANALLSASRFARGLSPIVRGASVLAIDAGIPTALFTAHGTADLYARNELTGGNFARLLGTNLLTWAAFHGVGMGMTRFGAPVRAELVEAERALERARAGGIGVEAATQRAQTARLRYEVLEAAQPVVNLVTLMGTTYFNDRFISGDPQITSVCDLLGSAARMQADMFIAHHVGNAISGGRWERLRGETAQRHAEYDAAWRSRRSSERAGPLATRPGPADRFLNSSARFLRRRVVPLLVPEGNRPGTSLDGMNEMQMGLGIPNRGNSTPVEPPNRSRVGGREATVTPSSSETSSQPTLPRIEIPASRRQRFLDMEGWERGIPAENPETHEIAVYRAPRVRNPEPMTSTAARLFEGLLDRDALRSLIPRQLNHFRARIRMLQDSYLAARPSSEEGAATRDRIEKVLMDMKGDIGTARQPRSPEESVEMQVVRRTRALNAMSIRLNTAIVNNGTRVIEVIEVPDARAVVDDGVERLRSFTRSMKAFRNDQVVTDMILDRVVRAGRGDFGDARLNVAPGVHEMRNFNGPGYRIYYSEHDGRAVVLFAEFKNDKTQTQSIARADRLRRTYLREQERREGRPSGAARR